MESLPLHILLVDDEPLALERTRRLLEMVGGVEIVGECANGREALERIEADPPDVVLLDINMPELDGMRVIEALDDPPAIILATADEHHAVRAFDLEVSDYLLKPFSAERLGRALAKIRRQLKDSSSETKATDSKQSAQLRIPADTGRGVELIPVENLSAARIEAGVVFLLRDDGERFCFAGTLQELERLLPEEEFLRGSRSAIINLRAASKYCASEEGGLVLTLRGGHEERVSRRRSRFFRARLQC